MEVLSSRILLRPTDPDRSRRFYRAILGLAVYREFGPADDPGLVFFLGQGFLEVSGRSTAAPGCRAAIWIQVRDVAAEHERLVAAGVRRDVDRGPGRGAHRRRADPGGPPAATRPARSPPRPSVTVPPPGDRPP